MITLEPKR